MAILNSTEYQDPYVMWPMRNIILGTFIPLFPITIVGNCLVIGIIVRNRSMRTLTNFFLANLAVADLMVALFCIIPQMMWFVSPTWLLGPVMCKLHKYMLDVTTKASIFILVAISGERFVAIIYPLRIRRVLTIGRLSCILCCLWLISFLLGIPSLRFYEESNTNGTRHCGVSLNISRREVILHNVFYSILCYVIPLFVMMFFYTQIIITLWLRGRAVYYRTARHGEKSSTSTSAMEMEVRMHTGGSVKSHAHRTHHGNASDSRYHGPNKENKVERSPDGNSHVQGSMADEHHNSLKIGPFFVDYPPASPRRDGPKGFKGSRSCENVVLLWADSSETPTSTLMRRKSQSTGAINHYYNHQNVCEAMTGEECPECFPTDSAVQAEFAVHAQCACRKTMNGTAIQIPRSGIEHATTRVDADLNPCGNKQLQDGSGDNKLSRTKPRPLLKKRSSGVLATKNGYDYLSTIDDDEGLTESRLEPCEHDVPFHQGSASGHVDGNSRLPSAVNKKKSTDGSDNRRPTVMVEIVPATRQSPNTSAVSRAKKISKSSVATRKKVIRMLVVLVVAFALCLFPMELFSIWTVVGDFPHFSDFGIVFMPSMYFAYFFNSALNPFLYAFLSDNFRMRMRETLDFRGVSRRARWMRTQTRLRSVTSEGTDNDWVS